MKQTPEAGGTILYKPNHPISSNTVSSDVVGFQHVTGAFLRYSLQWGFLVTCGVQSTQAVEQELLRQLCGTYGAGEELKVISHGISRQYTLLCALAQNITRSQ